MAAMVIIADDISHATCCLFKPHVRLKGIREAGTMKHPLAAHILDEGIAGVVAHNGKVISPSSSIRVAAGNALLVVTGKEMHRHSELPLAVLAIDAPRPLLGPCQRLQQQCRENPDDANDHQKLHQRERDSPCRPPGALESIAGTESSADAFHIAECPPDRVGRKLVLWTHTTAPSTKMASSLLPPPGYLLIHPNCYFGRGASIARTASGSSLW